MAGLGTSQQWRVAGGNSDETGPNTRPLLGVDLEEEVGLVENSEPLLVAEKSPLDFEVALEGDQGRGSRR